MNYKHMRARQLNVFVYLSSIHLCIGKYTCIQETLDLRNDFSCVLSSTQQMETTTAPNRRKIYEKKMKKMKIK